MVCYWVDTLPGKSYIDFQINRKVSHLFAASCKNVSLCPKTEALFDLIHVRKGPNSKVASEGWANTRLEVFKITRERGYQSGIGKICDITKGLFSRTMCFKHTFEKSWAKEWKEEGGFFFPRGLLTGKRRVIFRQYCWNEFYIRRDLWKVLRHRGWAVWVCLTLKGRQTSPNATQRHLRNSRCCCRQG